MLQKSNMYRTLGVFFHKPTSEHYLMDISRSLNLAHTSVKRNLNQLVRMGLIKKDIKKRGGRKFPVYRAELEKELFRRYKMIFNLASLLDSGLVDYVEERLAPKSLVVFGSYRRGEDVEDSDIDIFIECPLKELDFRKFERKLKRRIQVHANKDFSLYPKELKNNIINGIVLHGFLEGCT